MKNISLNEYLGKADLSLAEFGAKIGTTAPTVSRYASGGRIPCRKMMKKIFTVTNGAVDANSFYGLN